MLGGRWGFFLITRKLNNVRCLYIMDTMYIYCRYRCLTFSLLISPFIANNFCFVNKIELLRLRSLQILYSRFLKQVTVTK